MALKFIHEQDSNTACLEFHGNVQDLVAEITYMIANVHTALHGSSREAADAFRAFLSQIVADEDSPVWQIQKQEDGVTSVCIQIPKKRDDPPV